MPPRTGSRRTLLRLSLLALVAITLLLALLPQIVALGVTQALGRHGSASIDNVDINLFTGRLAIDELRLYRSAAEVLRVGHAQLEIDWRALWRKRIQIRSLTLDRLSITLEQSARGERRIGGIALPAPATGATGTQQPASPWGLGIAQLSLHHVGVQLIRPGLVQRFEVERLAVGPLQSWEPESATPFALVLRMNRARLALQGSATPFAGAPAARLDLQLTDFNLADTQPLLPAATGRLEGVLSASLAITIEQHADRLRLQQEGRLQLDRFSLIRPAHTLANRQLVWQGKSTQSFGRESAGATFAGTLTAGGLQLAQAANHLAAAIDTLSWQGELSLGSEVEALRGSGRLRIAGLSLGNTQQEAPHTTLEALALHGVTLRGKQEIHLAEVRLSGLHSTLRRHSEGLQPLLGHRAGAAEAAPPQSPPDHGATRLRVDALRLDGDNLIRFEDTTTRPAFRQSITPELFTLGAVDSAAPEQWSDFALKARLGNHGTLTSSGRLAPFLPRPALSLSAEIRHYEMPPLTPYLVHQIGYRIDSGQLDSDIALSIADETLQGEVHIRARQLEMAPEEPARIAQFEQKSNMPIKTALGLLRDDDGNIDIKVPITGRLDDPRFDISDAINTALANTLRSAAVSYLKYLLQPYSSVVTLFTLAGRVGGGVQLEPVTFEAGKAEPRSAATGYLEKLAALFAKRPALQLRLCGVATSADLAIISKGTLKQIPPEGHEALESLARQRAETIKQIMVSQYGVAPGRLFICHPELNRKADALPQVRLQL